MIWQDILIERPVTDGEIIAALATAFTTPAERINVIDEGGWLDSEAVAIFGERWTVEGDFAVHLHVSLRTDETIATTERLGDIELVGHFAQSLNTACFIGDDDDINPFAGLLIRSPSDVQPARLDPEAEDEDIYRLAPIPAHVS